MSSLQSEKATKRWADCATAATALGCGKTHVHDKLYARLKQEGLLDDLLKGGEAASEVVDIVRAWPEFNVESVTGWQSSTDDVPRTPVEKVKVAMWFIRKMGGVEAARKSIDAALLLQDTLG